MVACGWITHQQLHQISRFGHAYETTTHISHVWADVQHWTGFCDEQRARQGRGHSIPEPMDDVESPRYIQHSTQASRLCAAHQARTRSDHFW